MLALIEYEHALAGELADVVHPLVDTFTLVVVATLR